MYSVSVLFLAIVYLCSLSPSRCLTLSTSPQCFISIRHSLFNTQYVQDGDVIIGGIFTLSNCIRLLKCKSGQYVSFCDMPLPRFYRYVLAFRFAIDEINKNPDILPNMTLGYHAYDSCNNVNKAIDSALQILSGAGDTVPNYRCEELGHLVGVIGDLNPDISLHIAQILSIYGYAQISYGAADHLSTDSSLYPPFFQALPNYQTQCLAIVRLLRHYNWTWIGVITSDDDVGEKQSQELKAMAANYDICIEYIIKIRGKKGQNKTKIINSATSQVLVICGKASLAIIYFLRTLCDNGYEKTLIVPAGWLARTLISKIRKSPFHGSLMFSPPSKMIPELKTYIQDIILASHPNDYFLEYILAYYFYCLTSDPYMNKVFQDLYKIQLQECNRTLVLGEGVSYIYRSEDFRVAYLVYKSVYAMAHSLHDVQLYMLKTSNKNFRESHIFIKNILRRVSFKDPTGENVRFNEKGEMTTSYDIFSVVVTKEGEFLLRYTGNVNASFPEGDQLTFTNNATFWKNGKVNVLVSEVIKDEHI